MPDETQPIGEEEEPENTPAGQILRPMMEDDANEDERDSETDDADTAGDG